MSGPLSFLLELAKLLGLIDYIIAPKGKRPELLLPDNPLAPPEAPSEILDPRVAEAIEKGEL